MANCNFEAPARLRRFLVYEGKISLLSLASTLNSAFFKTGFLQIYPQFITN